MAAPINVKLESPTIELPDWPDEAQRWRDLNKLVRGNPDFYPLTIKFAYAVGVIFDLCESVTLLLKHPNALQVTYLPAYGVFASGIELLGRCIQGNSGDTGSSRDLKTGFKWLVESSYEGISDDYTLVTTSKRNYTIADLAALRHFAAHGQATTASPALSEIDPEILKFMPPLLADGVERYWVAVASGETMCNNLAKANVIALRGWPVLNTWLQLQPRQRLIDLFSAYDWHI